MENREGKLGLREMDAVFLDKKLEVGKVKICFVCPICRMVDIKIEDEFSVNPENYPEVKRDGFGNTVYICEAPCADCQNIEMRRKLPRTARLR